MTDNIDPYDDFFNRWESILADADIKSVPINFLKSVKIIMLDGTEENFDVEALQDRGYSIEEVEAFIETFIDTYDEEIDTLDFNINIELIASEIDKRTKRLLG